jgi:hypothetical protein
MVAEPQGPYHASSIERVDYAVRAVLPPGWIVRVQAPIALDAGAPAAGGGRRGLDRSILLSAARPRGGAAPGPTAVDHVRA